MESKSFFITIAGNIGVGKTTLTKKLAKDLDWDPILEPSSNNPYLEDFYKDMNKWALHSQLYFLTNRLKVHREILNTKHPVIQDRSIYEDAGIFAHNLFQEKYLNSRDYQLYRGLYEEFSKSLLKPRLLVYLQASTDTLQERIKKRNRPEENAIEERYLITLNKLYDEWAKEFTLCPVVTINTDELNVVRSKKDYESVKEKILGKITT